MDFEHALFEKLTIRHNNIIQKLSKKESDTWSETDMNEWMKYTEIAKLLLEKDPPSTVSNGRGRPLGALDDTDIFNVFLPLMTIYSTYKSTR